jgi:hypothetical protein
MSILVFNTTFNNISAITWQSVLLVEETGVPRETHDLQQVTDKLTNHIMMYWVHLTMSRIRTHNFGGCRHYLHIGSYKSNYHTIMTTSKDDLATNYCIDFLHWKMWLQKAIQYNKSEQVWMQLTVFFTEFY